MSWHNKQYKVQRQRQEARVNGEVEQSPAKKAVLQVNQEMPEDSVCGSTMPEVNRMAKDPSSARAARLLLQNQVRQIVRTIESHSTCIVTLHWSEFKWLLPEQT